MKKFFILSILIFTVSKTSIFAKNELYEKIDLFGEVIENIKKDYVDEVDQAEMMDSAINGVLQSLDPCVESNLGLHFFLLSSKTSFPELQRAIRIIDELPELLALSECFEAVLKVVSDVLELPQVDNPSIMSLFCAMLAHNGR